MSKMLITLFLLFSSALVFGQDLPVSANSQQPAPAETPSAPPPDAQGESISEAERIARLQKSIKTGESQIQELKARLDDPESEYLKAQTIFQELDAKRDAARANVEALEGKNDAAMLAAAREDLLAVEKQWDLAKERFDLAIQERKVSQEQLAALEEKLKGDQEAHAKLTQPKEAQRAKPEGSAGQQSAPSPNTTSQPPADSQAPAPAPLEVQPPSPVVSPWAGSAQPGAASPATAPPAAQDRKEVKEAEQAAEAKEVEAQVAEEEAKSLEDRITTLEQSIKAEQSLLDLAQKKLENAVKTGDTLSEEAQRQWANKATWTDTKGLWDQIQEQENLQKKTQSEIKERTARLASLQAQLSDLKDERIAAMEEAERKRSEAEQARLLVADLRNPFTVENLVKWMMAHGPPLLGILVGMSVLVLLARVLESRLVPLMARHGRGGNSIEDRENRAKTLMSVFHNTVRIVVIIGGILMLLAEVGLNIVPLVTAAGIAGLAIAFGAQNLIRDYFYGFTILLENQYMVNDVVRVAGISGMVERITLRITVLRDLEGVVHFVPHGEIKTVSNLTHGWSRALFDVGVAYKEDPGRVMKVLIDLGKELRRDPEFSPFILDDPEMLGVDQLGDSSVIVKFLIKTRPLKQWAVKREMLRRIKDRFDELGIEIPFPSRTIYHHYVDENGHGAEVENKPKPRSGRPAFAKSDLGE
jgi:small conductance mechanosensitive channel